jgi:lysophospholipase L1-like esterase
MESVFIGPFAAATPAPDYITIEHGTNGTTTSSDVQQLLVALRAAAPSAKIIQMSPRGGFARAAVAAGVAAANDANVVLVDLGTDYQTGLSVYTGSPNMFSVDGLHPNPLANMRAAAGFAGAIQAALSSSGSTPLANAVYVSNGRLKRAASGSTAPTGKRLTVK